MNISFNISTFKTQPCTSSHPPHHYPYYFNCPYYHHQQDKRRQPFLIDHTYLYSDQYVQGDIDEKYCRNWIQYLFHPLQWKQERCKVPNKCVRKYCPYIHENQSIEESYGQKQDKKEKRMDDNRIRDKIKGIKKIRQNGEGEEYKEALQQAGKRIIEKKCLFAQQDQQKQQKAENIKNHLQQLTNNNNSSSNAPVDMYYSQYHFGQQLDIIEDRYHEFKMFKDRDPKKIALLVLEYICAFMNSEGGTIYLGINDESIVHGLDVNQKWVDQFLCAVDNQGKLRMMPPLIPQKYHTRVVPVYNRKGNWLNVIEIAVYPMPYNERVLNLYNREGYIRMNASNHRLSATDIMEYMRMNTFKNVEEIIKGMETTLPTLQFNELKQVSRTITKFLSKLNTVIKKKEKQDNDVENEPQ